MNSCPIKIKICSLRWQENKVGFLIYFLCIFILHLILHLFDLHRFFDYLQKFSFPLLIYRVDSLTFISFIWMVSFNSYVFPLKKFKSFKPLPTLLIFPNLFMALFPEDIHETIILMNWIMSTYSIIHKESLIVIFFNQREDHSIYFLFTTSYEVALCY